MKAAPIARIVATAATNAPAKMNPKPNRNVAIATAGRVASGAMIVRTATGNTAIHASAIVGAMSLAGMTPDARGSRPGKRDAASRAVTP